MPSTARQLRQLPTIKAIERVLYFADKVDIKKYKFRVKYIKYFRYITTSKGIRVNLKKVKVIRN